MLVFQYGSNMSSQRLNAADRLMGDATFSTIAQTAEPHELEFSVWSKGNDCAAASIRKGPGMLLWGVVYEIPDHLVDRRTAGTRKSLDAVEGEGTNYVRREIALILPSGQPINATTYIAKNPTPGLKTSDAYVKHILVGLAEHKIPEEYAAYVKERVRANNPAIKL